MFFNTTHARSALNYQRLHDLHYKRSAVRVEDVHEGAFSCSQMMDVLGVNWPCEWAVR